MQHHRVIKTNQGSVAHQLGESQRCSEESNKTNSKGCAPCDCIFKTLWKRHTYRVEVGVKGLSTLGEDLSTLGEGGMQGLMALYCMTV